MVAWNEKPISPHKCRLFQETLEAIEAVSDPKGEAHVPDYSSKVKDIYGIGDHGPRSIYDHIVQGSDNIRISDNAILSKGVSVLQV